MKFEDKSGEAFEQIQKDIRLHIDTRIRPIVESYVRDNAPVVTGTLRDSGESDYKDSGDKMTFIHGSTSGYGRYVPRYLQVLGRALSIGVSYLRR